MAGSQNAEDNPVAINVVPMVDVIFCLCLFFMCSLKFKQLEGKFDSWLPQNKGLSGPTTVNDLIKEIRIAMRYDKAKQETTRQIGDTFHPTNETLEQSMRSTKADFLRLGKENVPVTLDVEREVPWRDVIIVFDLCKKNDLNNIEFAYGAPLKT